MLVLLTMLVYAVPEAGDAAPHSSLPVIGWVWHDQSQPIIPTPYVPQEGDLFFSSHSAPLRTMAYWAFRTGHPLHCGIIVRNAEGRLMLFETGGGDNKTTTLLPIDRRFSEEIQNRKNGMVWVRSIKRSLTTSESARLAAFANAELGKRLQPNYKYLRLAIPGRPTRSSNDGQQEWFCSELVVQGLLDAGTLQTHLPAGSLVPADLFYDRRVNLGDRWSPPCQWTPHAVLPH